VAYSVNNNRPVPGKNNNHTDKSCSESINTFFLSTN